MRTKEGMPFGASSRLGFWLSLNILGCHGHPQDQSLATLYSIVHQFFTQKLENFTTQNSTGNLMSSVSARKKNHHLRYCNELIIQLYWCNIFCIPTSPWFIPPDTTHRFIKISKQHTKNRISQKQNSLQKSVTLEYLCNSKNPTKLGKPEPFVQQSR